MTHGKPAADRLVAVQGLARVEGEGSLRAVVSDGRVTEVELRIFEPPRFFEALLRGRGHLEAPDITARVCGICPVAYQMSACRAIEEACGVDVPPGITALRRLLYCGEWIQSHALHIYLLHAPDFFAYRDGVELAEHDPVSMRRGLALKKTGNLIMETIGGRAVHPVNVRVGGFYRAPPPEAVASLAEPLREARGHALDTLMWASRFEFPDMEGDHVFVALHQGDRYAIESGTVRSSAGGGWTEEQFAGVIAEEQVARSTALHATIGGRRYLTGPLARYALNRDRLGPLAKDAAHMAGIGESCTNPFRSILVRAVELVEACDEALRLVAAYQPPDPPFVEVPARAGTGFGITEAPRGLLLHGYRLDAQGTIAWARIVAPTSQNQLSIEADLRRVVESGLHLDDGDLTRRCEQAIRNHDPCISCAAHFLDVEVVR